MRLEVISIEDNDGFVLRQEKRLLNLRSRCYTKSQTRVFRSCGRGRGDGFFRRVCGGIAADVLVYVEGDEEERGCNDNCDHDNSSDYLKLLVTSFCFVIVKLHNFCEFVVSVVSFHCSTFPGSRTPSYLDLGVNPSFLYMRYGATFGKYGAISHIERWNVCDFAQKVQ